VPAPQEVKQAGRERLYAYAETVDSRLVNGAEVVQGRIVRIAFEGDLRHIPMRIAREDGL